MQKIEWNPTIRGYKAIYLNGRYILEIWNHLQSGGWITSVNAEMMTDEATGKSKIFNSLEGAKAAAESFTESMIRER